MKKKISILTIVFLFFISTTGLPVWSHYCEMMGKNSLNGCDDCVVELEEVETSCCLAEIPESNLIIATENSTCCFDVFDYKQIEDDFFHTITSNLIPITSVVTELHLSSFNSQNEIKFVEQTNYDFPPPKFGKELLYTIHQLKLDLPVY